MLAEAPAETPAEAPTEAPTKAPAKETPLGFSAVVQGPTRPQGSAVPTT